MDIEIIIKKGFIYSILMAAIIGIYSLLMFIGQNIFQAAFGINQWIATIVTAFVIAVGYKPLESFLTDFTNQYFFRKKYDYQKTLMQSSEAMNLLTDIDRLVRLTTRIVARRMDLVETSTLIYEEAHHRYVVKAAEGKSKEMLGTTFSDNFELFKHLFSSKNILVKDEVTQTLNSKLVLHDERKRLSTIKKEMEKLHAQLCIPSITRGKYMGNKLVAVFCMGEKKSGDMYSNEDIQLLTTLSNQAAIAIENALMYSDLMKQFKELKETKDALVQSEKLAALGTMAAGIAHEIRNPLTSLQLFVQMMAERFDDHEFREKFTQIVPPEIERLNRIVNDLVSFAKPSKLTREPNQINEILEKTIRLSEISFKKLNVKVVREFNDVPKVMVDPQQIMQIFLNLIMNGAQAMQSGGTLTVRTRYDDFSKKVCVDIQDTGHGISEENLKKLYSPFFTTKEGGTGLGLAITRRIIEEHKGEIKVKSKVGEGTTFTVELPIAV
jgi:C4-dicarboxylate-specific signal transduction histidine kinase